MAEEQRLHVLEFEEKREQERILWEKREQERVAKEKREQERKEETSKSQRLEESNDNIRLALDILNYTVSGSKESREKVTVLNAENCIFQVVTIWGNQKLYVNNIIPDTARNLFERLFLTSFRSSGKKYTTSSLVAMSAYGTTFLQLQWY